MDPRYLEPTFLKLIKINVMNINEHEDFKEEMERLRALRGKSKKNWRKKKDD